MHGNRVMLWVAMAVLVATRATSLAAKAKSEAAAGRSVSALLGEGQSALAAGDFKAARDAFADVLVLDPRNGLALEGATVAYVELADFPHAKAALEKTLSLSERPSRAVAINGASVFLRTRLPMRAAKILMQYISSQPQVDEEALNALATVLSQTDDQTRKAPLYSTAVKFYTTNNARLEASRPGMKRWGTQWGSADDVDQKDKAWKAALASTDATTREIPPLQSQLADAERDIRERQNLIRIGAAPRDWADVAIQRAQTIEADIKARQDAVEKTLASTERPPIPKTIAPIGMGGAAPTQLVVAVSTTPTTPAPTSPAAVAATPSVERGADPGRAPAAPAATTPPAEPPAAPAVADAPKKYRLTSYAAAFPVSPTLLVTAAQAVDGASEIQVQSPDGTAMSASVLRSDAQSGLSLLRVASGKLRFLNVSERFTGGSLSCVSFPSVDIFQPEAAIIAGSAVPAKAAGWTVRLSHSPRLAGGPLMAMGKVVGVELASRDSDLNAIPAATLEDLRKLLGSDALSGGGVDDGASALLQVSAVHEK